MVYRMRRPAARPSGVQQTGPADTDPDRTGLILSGGGARAAYQVGVLKAIADLLPPGSPTPFRILCGTSAGAINAAALASYAHRFRAGVRGLEAVWRDFRACHVYRTGFCHLSLNAARWLGALFFGGLGVRRPDSLLDNSPLEELIEQAIRFGRIRQAVDSGMLRALSVTASCYRQGESVAFYQGAPDLAPWRRARRGGQPAVIDRRHLMASSAIPGIFPPVRLGGRWYGDGAVRQIAPISPALHLGARRVLVIGVSASPGPAGDSYDAAPSLADVAGHVFNSAFIDSLESDLERLERINSTLQLLPSGQPGSDALALRPVETLVIRPSVSPAALAGRYGHELPASMRFFLRGTGASRGGESVILSYLLFERGYCRALLDLGYHDAMRREPQLRRFLGLEEQARAYRVPHPPADVC